MNTLKHYVASSGVTFLATFFTVIGAQLAEFHPDTLTTANAWHVAIASIIVAAVRAAFKTVLPDYSVAGVK